MLKKLLLAGVVSFCSISSATAGSSTASVTIKSLSVGWSGEGIYIRLNETFPLTEGCTEPVFIMPPGTPLFDENLSLALSAFHTKTKVDLHAVGCLYNGMKLTSVSLKSE